MDDLVYRERWYISDGIGECSQGADIVMGEIGSEEGVEQVVEGSPPSPKRES